MSIETMLREHPFLVALNDEHIARLASCAQTFRADMGRYLWRQGDLADVIYMIQSGQVALEISVPHQGPLEIETIGEGEIIGWSWLISPHRWQFDARALTPLRAIMLEGGCVRRMCDEDPAFGYQFTRRFSRVMAERLQALRLRLLESYRAARM